MEVGNNDLLCSDFGHVQVHRYHAHTHTHGHCFGAPWDLLNNSKMAKVWSTLFEIYYIKLGSIVLRQSRDYLKLVFSKVYTVRHSTVVEN